MAVDDSGRDIVLEAALRKLFGGENPFGVMALLGTLDASGNPVEGLNLLSGEDETNDVIRVEQGQFGYQVVPVTTATALGAGGGAAGDFLHKILALDATTSIVIKDGSTTVFTWTITAATEPNELELNCVCGTNWELTCTGAGATAIGRFT